ncbi:hypothetical protein [Microbulbifer sp. YPW1]|uniref:hypothetical protein n=1 Tax=Microbulbifer sp. YPW1 TaxID=2745199 RepID=UPI00159B6ADF|nr:hypothetical protein [Microbulbifer sp. YPW1]QKX18589.1 hypothetical protein HUW35_17335 [Microbulbifer sp. YPW1]
MKAISKAALFLSIAIASPFSAAACSITDVKSCNTCSQLDATIDYENPSAGDYFRGARWNGLYAAYLRNCPLIGAKLIKKGANPVSGGLFGSMIMTVSQKWPHNDKKINEMWASLLLTADATLDKNIKEADRKDTKEIVAEVGSFKPDYFDLYILFED